MKVFIQSIVAQLLLNPYIYWRGHQALPRQKKWQVTYFLLFLFEICLYLFGSEKIYRIRYSFPL